jgi:hypothetical protein
VPRCHVASTRGGRRLRRVDWLAAAVLPTGIVAGADFITSQWDRPAAGPRRLRNRHLTWTPAIGALRYSLIACAHLEGPVANDRFVRPASWRTDYPDLGSQRLDRCGRCQRLTTMGGSTRVPSLWTGHALWPPHGLRPASSAGSSRSALVGLCARRLAHLGPDGRVSKAPRSLSGDSVPVKPGPGVFGHRRPGRTALPGTATAGDADR